MAELGVRRPANKILAISNTRILLILYSANSSDKTDKTDQHGVKFHAYADDSQRYAL